MALRVLVKLKDEDGSLCCAETGWMIRRNEVKLTPLEFSSTIRSWLRNGALLPVLGDDSVYKRYSDLLAPDPSVMTVPDLQLHVKQINSVAGSGTITFDEESDTREDVCERIFAWRRALADENISDAPKESKPTAPAAKPAGGRRGKKQADPAGDES